MIAGWADVGEFGIETLGGFVMVIVPSMLVCVTVVPMRIEQVPMRTELISGVLVLVVRGPKDCRLGQQQSRREHQEKHCSDHGVA